MISLFLISVRKIKNLKNVLKRRKMVRKSIKIYIVKIEKYFLIN